MNKIWLSTPSISELERMEIAKALERNELSLGEGLAKFRLALERTFGRSVSLVSSGTAAMHLALITLGIEPGDEVLCATLTFAATANPVVYCQAKPVFIDSEPETWNISPDLVEHAIKTRIKAGRKPKALIVVDLYGMPCNYDALQAICKNYEVLLIEDAAESLGSTYNDRALGAFGDAAILSFNANKIITTGGGGALLSNDEKITTLASNLAAQARDEAEYYLHSRIGYNYRMNNIAAIMGEIEFRDLENRVNRRRSIFDLYSQRLASLGVKFQLEKEGSFSNRWLSAFTLPKKGDWQKVQNVLRENNIESRPIWKPLHTQPVFKDAERFLNGTSEDLFERGICLPSSVDLSKEDQELVCELIVKALA